MVSSNTEKNKIVIEEWGNITIGTVVIKMVVKKSHIVTKI